MGFHFKGSLSSSKSLYNRALVVQSFYPQLSIDGESLCEDVLHLKKALLDFVKGSTEFYVGHGGTTYRFLLARLSRKKGHYKIKGSHRLMSRPHDGLYRALKSLGAIVKPLSSSEVSLQSSGWPALSHLPVDTIQSSQFASALLLSCWDLKQDIHLQWSDSSPSASYLEMTLRFLKSLGMRVESLRGGVLVKAGQTPKLQQIAIEPDLSSAFALAAFAAHNGELHLDSFPNQSLQPDFRFIELLKSIGSQVELTDGSLRVKKGQLLPLSTDLSKTPDLFPVLATLLARAEGQSCLGGLSVLPFKESNRIQKTTELLNAMGVITRFENDQFFIEGTHSLPFDEIIFDPDHDHRMAMAAALACFQGSNIRIMNPEVVNKSFPEFWEIVGQ